MGSLRCLLCPIGARASAEQELKRTGARWTQSEAKRPSPTREIWQRRERGVNLVTSSGTLCTWTGQSENLGELPAVAVSDMPWRSHPTLATESKLKPPSCRASARHQLSIPLRRTKLPGTRYTLGTRTPLSPTYIYKLLVRLRCMNNNPVSRHSFLPPHPSALARSL